MHSNWKLIKLLAKLRWARDKAAKDNIFFFKEKQKMINGIHHF